MNWLRGTKGTLLVAALAMSGTTCTLLLDHSAIQCNTDDDCNTLGTYPHCDRGLCKPSGLQPNKCFRVDPSHIPVQEADFLNACSPNAMLLVQGGDSMESTCLSFATKADDGATIKAPPTTPANTPKLPTAPTMTCTALAAGKPTLYISGSSNFAPLLQELSQVIVNTIGIVPVFRTTTSCTGVKSMNPMSPTYPADHYIKDPATTGPEPYPSYAQIFLGDGSPPVNCLLGMPTEVTIGESEIAQDTCGGPVNPPEMVGENPGPILPIVFAVPKFSLQKSISAEAAKQVFGGGGGVAPWEDPRYLYIRGQGTATLRLVAKEIGLLPTQVWGTDQGSASAMADNLAGLLTASEANLGIGIIGTDFYDQQGNRDRLKALGFQALGESCAYLPDSSLTSRDKINVRDGHYPLWGRIHFFASRVNSAIVPSTAASFMNLFVNPYLDADIFAALIKAGFVPPCAMQVTRTTELGDFTYSVPPPIACGCAFDAQVGAALNPSCTTCSSNSDCVDPNRPSCRYGYCEKESM